MTEKLTQSTAGQNLKPGVDYIGVGVGALILNDEGKILMGLRGKKSRNEIGKWEIPGGQVEFGEKLEAALVREIEEEIGAIIEVLELLRVADDILFEDKQHWISPTYICRIISGEPCIQELEKCEKLEWFSVEEALTMSLSAITRADLEHYQQLENDECECGGSCGCDEEGDGSNQDNHECHCGHGGQCQCGTGEKCADC